MKLSKKLTFTITFGLLLVLPVLASLGSASSAVITPEAAILDGTARDVLVEGTTAYISAGAGGLKIYDISNPLAPVKIGENGNIGYAESVDIDGNIAWVAAGEEGLVSVDISDPTNPTFVQSYRNHGTDEHTTEVIVENGIAYYADGEDGFEIAAVSPVGQIIPRDDYDTIGTTYVALEYLSAT